MSRSRVNGTVSCTGCLVAVTVRESASIVVLAPVASPTVAVVWLEASSTAKEAPTPASLLLPVFRAPARAWAEIRLVSSEVTATSPTGEALLPRMTPAPMLASVSLALATTAREPATATVPPLAPEMEVEVVLARKPASMFWLEVAATVMSPAWVTWVPAPRLAWVVFRVAVRATAAAMPTLSDTAAPVAWVA